MSMCVAVSDHANIIVDPHQIERELEYKIAYVIKLYSNFNTYYT